MNKDQEHLNLLSVFHYIVGGLTALCACFPVIHLGIGIAILAGALDDASGPGPPQFVGALFIVFAALAMLVGWAFAACLILAGRYLAAGKHHTFCLVIAAISCLCMPFGTILGIFTIIVLARPSVKTLFNQPPTPPQ